VLSGRYIEVLNAYRKGMARVLSSGMRIDTLAVYNSPMSSVAPRQIHALLFGALWAFAHLAHAFRKEPTHDPLSWLYLLACVLLICRPASPARLGLLCLAQLAVFVGRLPLTDNHMYIMAFANAGLLVVTAPLVVKRRGWDVRAFGVARNYVVVVFLMAYFAAALAKLNEDFLFGEASCALSMMGDAMHVIGMDRSALLASVSAAVPFMVAGVELAVPLLLAIGAVRSVGIIMAVLFHLAISISPTATAIDFTVIIFTVLALLVPVDSWLAKARTKHLPSKYRPPVGRATVGILFLFFVLVVFEWRLGTVAGNRSWMLLAPVALVLGAALVVAAVKLRGVSDGYRVSLSRLSAAHFPLLALLVLNIASPYVGLKTAGTFTMYSNLSTYQNKSNHYLIPRFNRGTMHDDLVEIVSTTNARLQSLQERGLLVTWHELRRDLARDSTASISYVRGGEVYTYPRAADNPELVTLDPVLHKLLAHRPHAGVQGSCMW
jgi:hypothetical protein